MLRINLLPAYVAQRRLNKNLTVLYTFVFAIVVAGMLAYQFLVLVPQDANETSMAATAQSAQTDLTNMTTQASTISSSVAPIQANIDFVNNVAKYNTNFPTLYETVAKFTSPRILYYGMAVSGSTLTINAYTPSIEELGRYLQIMYHEPDFTSVSVSAIPNPEQAAEKIYYYKGVEIGRSGGTKTTSTTTLSVPGVPAGVPFNLPSTMKNGAAQPGQPPQQGMGFGGMPRGMQGMQNMRGQGPQAVAGGDAPTNVYAFIDSDPDFNSKYFKVITKKTDGFTFTATCTLKTTFAPPAVPGGAATAGGSPGALGGLGGSGGG